MLDTTGGGGFNDRGKCTGKLVSSVCVSISAEIVPTRCCCASSANLNLGTPAGLLSRCAFESEIERNDKGVSSLIDSQEQYHQVSLDSPPIQNTLPNPSTMSSDRHSLMFGKFCYRGKVDD